MKRALLALALLSATPFASAAVGVSVTVGQPGFYGRLDIGNAYPSPMLLYPEPMVIAPPAPGVVRAPIYLHVPPGHASDWARHCHRYRACGRPVYFVQPNWYEDVYVPRYRERHPPPPPRPIYRDGPPGHGYRDGPPGHGYRDGPPGQVYRGDMPPGHYRRDAPPYPGPMVRPGPPSGDYPRPGVPGPGPGRSPW